MLYAPLPRRASCLGSSNGARCRERDVAAEARRVHARKVALHVGVTGRSGRRARSVQARPHAQIQNSVAPKVSTIFGPYS